MTIAEAKAELVAALKAKGLVCEDHVPEELLPPVAVLDGDEDYLKRGDTYSDDEQWLNMRLFVLVSLVGNAQAAEDLDTALTQAIAGLLTTSWEQGSMTRPGPFHTTEWLAHGVAINVSTLVNLTS